MRSCGLLVALVVLGCSQPTRVIPVSDDAPTGGSAAPEEVTPEEVTPEGAKTSLKTPGPITEAPAASAGLGSNEGKDSPGAHAVIRHGLAWYEDAPEAAFAAARAERKLVVIDAWAAWCHTCLSMQNFVITAENLPGASSRFVWLAIDTEREKNAAFLKEFPVGVWPTFYVLEPASSKIVGRWLGAASPAQFERFLNEGERAAALLRANGLSADEPLALVIDADTLATRGDFPDAARAYAKALAVAPSAWPRRPEVLVAQMTALWKAKDFAGCAELAAKAMGQTGSAASAVDFAHYALECASQLPAGQPAVAALRRTVERRLEGLCQEGSTELSPDDRADACDNLAAARAALGDATGARNATLERLNVLEHAAAGKPPEVALTYDWARTDALIALDRAEEALAIAVERERGLPSNYNPPHYQAKSYKALGRWQEGLAALDRALGLAYGPRRIGLLTLKADLLIGASRKSEAVQTLEEQLAAYRALPDGQKQPAAAARVERRLLELGAAADDASP